MLPPSAPDVAKVSDRVVDISSGSVIAPSAPLMTQLGGCAVRPGGVTWVSPAAASNMASCGQSLTTEPGFEVAPSRSPAQQCRPVSPMRVCKSLDAVLSESASTQQKPVDEMRRPSGSVASLGLEARLP